MNSNLKPYLFGNSSDAPPSSGHLNCYEKDFFQKAKDEWDTLTPEMKEYYEFEIDNIRDLIEAREL
jgi:hypothetical protein